MKILIVYYSRTGLTKKLGEKLADTLSAQTEEIKDEVARGGVIGYLRCGKEAMQDISPVILDSKNNPADYDLVIIGTPVWAATMASPVRSYLIAQKDKFKRVAFFATQGGEGANRTVEKMTEVCGLKPVASLVVLSREIVKDSCSDKVQQFIKKINS